MDLELGVRKIKTVAEPSDPYRPASGSRVTVAYTGKLPDGTVFDSSSRADTETVSFILGDAHVTSGEA